MDSFRDLFHVTHRNSYECVYAMNTVVQTGRCPRLAKHNTLVSLEVDVSSVCTAITPIWRLK